MKKSDEYLAIKKENNKRDSKMAVFGSVFIFLATVAIVTFAPKTEGDAFDDAVGEPIVFEEERRDCYPSTNHSAPTWRFGR